jgi:prepilin-type N-terminal cleavage/methylation domain-containing protein
MRLQHYHIIEARRASKAGFSLVELLVAMGMTAVISIGAYAITIKSTRRLTETGERNAFTLSIQHFQSLVRNDLTHALRIIADTNSAHLECMVSNGTTCTDSVIISTITPRIDKDVEGDRTGFQSIRFVVPKKDVVVRLVKDMGSEDDDLRVTIADAKNFDVGTFVHISDGDKADVFYVTRKKGVGQKVDLMHESPCSGGPEWNHCNGLSKAYTGIKTVSLRPVDVVTIGLSTGSDGTFLVRKTEGIKPTRTRLSKAIATMSVDYFGSGITETDPAQTRAPDRELWPWILRVQIAMKQLHPQTEPIADNKAGTTDSQLVAQINVALRQYK